MARILIDARWLKQTGIGRYTENILIEMVAQKTKHDLVLLLRPEDVADLPQSLKKLERHETDVVWYTPQEQIKLPMLINEIKPDLVHFPQFNIPLQYRKPFVVTIHDLTMLRFKNIRGGLLAPFTYTLKDVVMRHVLKTAIKRSKIIFTPSQFVRADIAKQYGIPDKKIIVTPNAADQPHTGGQINLKKFAIKKPFLLHVGNAYPNKNLERLIRAVAEFNKDQATTIQLVLAGKKDDFHIFLEKLCVKLKLDDMVIFTDRVSEAELTGLYKEASLYVLPSLSEGFGIPGLEAMSYDLPVLSSRETCLPEVFGDAAEYFDAKDVHDIAQTIRRVLGDPKRQQELRRKGKQRLGEYSWSDSAKAVLKGYDEALKKQPQPNPIQRFLGRK
ncbi:MAG: glycosyltransferase family 1 protein [Candidatus Saccharibacteria bacterium]